MFTSDVI